MSTMHPLSTYLDCYETPSHVSVYAEQYPAPLWQRIAHRLGRAAHHRLALFTDVEYAGIDVCHPMSESFTVLQFADGNRAYIPHHLVDSYLGTPFNQMPLCIGKGSGIGQGSKIKYDGGHHKLIVHRYVSMGQRIRFILGARHNTHMIASFMLRHIGMQEMNEAALPPLGDITIHNDVWIGDEAMIMGGAIIGDGCVVGARALVTQNMHLEPYSVYGGSPAKRIRLRFSEKIVELLLQIRWWELPVEWLRDYTEFFTLDLTVDEQKSLEYLQELRGRIDARKRAGQ